MRQKRYTVVALAAVAAMALAEIGAKIGWLGNWSAVAYVVVSLVLIATFIAAVFLGIRHDEDVDRAGPDDDY
jgi:uncharacterized membrane protein